MGATLEGLHRLQEIELQISEMNRRIARKLALCRKQKSGIADLDKDVRARQELLRADQIEADRLSLDAKANEVEIDKYRAALNASKTNKEYSAVLTQLNTFKADTSKLEERILQLLTQIDQKKEEIVSVEQDREKEVAKLGELETAARGLEEKSRPRIDELQRQRDNAAEAVPATALAVFDRVAKKNDGEAMALVIRTNPKRQEYACEGCNMSITIEQVNTILSRDEAVLCNVCGRILFLDSPATSKAS